MTTDASLEPAQEPLLPSGLRTLWADACSWVAWFAGVFAPETLRVTGLSREQGARLSLWLRNIESGVRRLILAAALAFTPAAPRQTRTAARKPRPAHAAPRAAFRVFGLRRASASRPTQTPPPRAPRPYGHIPFPADPLLALGPAPPRVRRTTKTLRTPNPLDRWVRLSRQDPDWRPPKEAPFRDTSDEDRFAWLFEDTTLDHRPPPKPRPARKPHDPDAFPDSLWDWRRCHDEWEKAVPAPGLAARLEALERVIANPAATIAGAARRLARPHNRGPRPFHDAIPSQRLPRRAVARLRPTLTADFADNCHDKLCSPDTS